VNFSKSFKKPYLGFKTPAIMGILNITPDSFSDGGKYFSKPSIAIKNAIKMHRMGANIIDIGAESTRPGALPVKPEIEIKRLKPIIFGFKGRAPGLVDSAPISIIFAPILCILIAFLIAILGLEKYLPPSEKLSGVIFKIPIIAGVLKPKYGFLKDLEKFTVLF
jgi:hypothetical protein